MNPESDVCEIEYSCKWVYISRATYDVTAVNGLMNTISKIMNIIAKYSLKSGLCNAYIHEKQKTGQDLFKIYHCTDLFSSEYK